MQMPAMAGTTGCFVRLGHTVGQAKCDREEEKAGTGGPSFRHPRQREISTDYVQVVKCSRIKRVGLLKAIIREISPERRLLECSGLVSHAGFLLPRLL